MSADAVLRALAHVLAPLVAEELAKRTEPNAYSTAEGNWPREAKSRRHARDLIRRVPGHEQIGTGRAVVWRVSAEAYRAFYTRRAAPVIALATRDTDDALAAKYLDAANLRKTRSA